MSLPSIIFVESVKVLQTRPEFQPDIFLERGRERALGMRLAFVRATGAGLTLETAASLIVSWEVCPSSNYLFHYERISF